MSKKARSAPKGISKEKAGVPPAPVSSLANDSSLLLPPPPPPSSSSALTRPSRAPSSSTNAPKTSRLSAHVPPLTSSSSVGSAASSDNGSAPRKLLRKRPSAAVSGGLATRNGEGKTTSTTVPMLDEAVVLRDLLAWNLLSDVDAQRSGGRRSPPPPSSATSSDASVPTTAPQASLVREQFDSVAQYRSLWLRLVLRETRAVVLNQVEREGCEGGPAMTIDAQEVAQQQPGEPLFRLRVTLANRCFGDGRSVLPGCSADHLVWLVPEGPPASRALASLQVQLKDPPPIPGQNGATSSSTGSGLASHQVAAARAQARRAEKEKAAAGGPATATSSSGRAPAPPPPAPPQGLLALFSTRQFPMEVRVAAPAWRRFQSTTGSNNSSSSSSGIGGSGSGSSGTAARQTSRRLVAIPVASAVSSLRELKALCRLQHLHPRLLGAVLSPEVDLSRSSSEHYGGRGGSGLAEAANAEGGAELASPPPPPYSPPYSPFLQQPKPNALPTAPSSGSDLDTGSSSSSDSSSSSSVTYSLKEPVRDSAWQREIDDMNIGPGFAAYLDKAFNASQRRAILAAARAVAMPESSKSRRRSLGASPATSSASSTSLKVLPRHSTTSSSNVSDFASSNHSSSSSSSSPQFPRSEGTPQVPVFTLIKGPPGTGKTTTLKGLLNLLHVREYSRYYDQVVAQELKRARQTLANSSSNSSSDSKAIKKDGAMQPPPPSAMAGASASGSSTNSSSSNNGDTVRKPRLLVAAPSNVAVDNVLAKVIADGFLDGAGQRYNPRIVRVGRGQGPGVREVSMETLVEAIGVRDERSIAAELQQRQEKQHQVQCEYGQAHRILVALLKGCDLASASGGLPLHWEVRADPTTATPYFVNHAAKTTSLKPPGSNSREKANAKLKDGRAAAIAPPPAVVSLEAQERVGTPAEAAAKAKAAKIEAAAQAAAAKATAAAAAGAEREGSLKVQDPEALAAALKRSEPSQQPEYSATLNALVQHREKLEKLRLEIKQRIFALDALTAGRSDAALGNRGSGGTINNSQRHALQLALEANILDEAHVVFTTLNSAAAECFRTTDPFAVCVIDEAAQATEPALLAPLLSGRTGASRCVLVGDPQQLRATAFSVNSGTALGAQPLAAGLANFEDAHRMPSKSSTTATAATASAAVTPEKAVTSASSSSTASSSQLVSSSSPALSLTEQEDLMLSRSLFERLETAGHFVHLLNTQYRMHPSISAFPRHVFYSGALKDATSVGPPNPDYVELFHAQFPPFLFLDVLPEGSGGGGGGGATASTSTRSNPREAAVLLQCYLEMKAIASMGQKLLPGRVGVLTPYREQLKVLERAFDRAGVLHEVELHTVDGYQGREKDVILVSTARGPQPNRASKASGSSSSSSSGGGGGGGVGFLADTRRMNVALTRAKSSLVVCGSAQALQVDPHWRALVNMATRQRVCAQVPSRGDPQSLNLASLVASAAASTDNQQAKERKARAQKDRASTGGGHKKSNRRPPPPPPPPPPLLPPSLPPSSAQLLPGSESQPPLLLPSYAATHHPGGLLALQVPATTASTGHATETRPEKRPRPPSPDEEGEVSDNGEDDDNAGDVNADDAGSGVSGSFWFDTAGTKAEDVNTNDNTEGSDGMSSSDEEVIGFGGVE